MEAGLLKKSLGEEVHITVMDVIEYETMLLL